MDDIDPGLLQQLLTLDDGQVICPLKVERADVNKVKAVKLSEAELPKLDQFQAYLFDRHYIPENSFAALFVYLFNFGYTLHRVQAEKEAKGEKDNA
ncbi:hypothetical protein LCGC14_0918540 [marine sediment metagenome]|uniref:Uncharacterized protein n=1 Tax=marine sediment metagenome TaxID=412755 RepID=A0A0F9RA56_9ZZZZ